MARTAFFITVTGQVQGVGYRAFVHRHAAELGLDGWVRNRRDGTSKSPSSAIRRQSTQWLRWHRGPTLAEVGDITVSGADDDGTTGFHERPTT